MFGGRPDFPFSPARFPFFYGWVILIVSILAMVASIPGQTIGVGVFTDHLIEHWGLTRVQLSTAYMFGTIGSSLLLPHAGRLTDRLGIRAMVLLGTTGLGLGILGLSQGDRLLGVATPYLLVFVVVLLLFLVIRFFGQGCLSMISRMMLGKWFNRRRGLATGIAGVVITLVFNSSPTTLNLLIEHQGWRTAGWQLALGLIFVFGLLGWLFIRDNPEECGLEMDGGVGRDELTPEFEKVRHEFTRREAIRTRAFWIFSLALGCHSYAITAVAFHLASIGAERGLDRDDAFFIFVPMAVFSIGANLFSGWLSDRVRLKWILAAFLITQVVGSMGLINLDLPIGKWLTYAGFGISGGCFVTLITVTWPRFFGRRHLGEITGINMFVLVFTSAIGPVTFSAMFSYTGSYQPIILGYLFIPAALLALGLRTDNPQLAYEPVPAEVLERDPQNE